MPFKTKREKIAAAARRFTFVDTQVVDYLGKEAKVEAENKVQVAKTGSGTDRRTIESNYGYVKRDLVKIIFLTNIIIFAQIILLVFLRHS